MSTKDKTIEDLVSMVLMQYEEIKKLKNKIAQIKQHIEIYEEFMNGDER